VTVSGEERKPPQAPIAAIVLAAGTSGRWGDGNKLLAEVAGKPLVEHAARAALDAGCDPVLVVTGNERAEIEAALAGLPVRVVHNPDFARGLATSVRNGVAAVPRNSVAVVVLLGDMPWVRAGHVRRLCERFDPERPRVLVPEWQGRRGNPVLWPRQLFAELAALEGDRGGRQLLARHPDLVETVSLDEAVLRDVDAPEDLPEDRAR
jgi:molybdenum cofactor cytidylyltransferase